MTLWGVLNLGGSYITDSAHVTDLKKAKGLSCVAGWSERERERAHSHTDPAVSSCHVDMRASRSEEELCQCQRGKQSYRWTGFFRVKLLIQNKNNNKNVYKDRENKVRDEMNELKAKVCHLK